MPRRFMQAARWGTYFRVLEEGTVETGDGVEFVSRDSELATLVSKKDPKLELIHRALAIPSLTRSWREMLQEASQADTHREDNR